MPLSLTPFGGGLATPLTTKPIETSSPADRSGFQEGAAAVTVVPLSDTVAFQPLCRVAPGATSKLTVQPALAVAPFSTVTVPR